jgi:hypothetical protein
VKQNMLTKSKWLFISYFHFTPNGNNGLQPRGNISIKLTDSLTQMTIIQNRPGRKVGYW